MWSQICVWRSLRARTRYKKNPNWFDIILAGVLYELAETWWDADGIFACPDTDPFSARCQNRKGHSPLAIHSAVCVHALVLLAAGSVLCYGESINLTCDMSNGRLNAHSERRGRNIQICWRADLTGFGSVKFKETQRRACTYYRAHLPYLNSILGSLQGQGPALMALLKRRGARQRR